MSGLTFGRVRAFMLGPAGSSPTDVDGWQDFGYIEGDGIAFAPDPLPQTERLKPWPSGPISFTIPIRWIRCSWQAHRCLYGRPHPEQRRAKTLYRQRARRRARGRR
ncbi:hypothetical protein [Nonomuraea basaltis]|uniref:hypothetical protein n=1 Tax=Nonomuraea basaltis TaxID=2495887 RepID=UPI00110C639F|nr:hypothetical protein [Nonomuraea basaltis]TMR92577.1 hypothetical protein EJK15_44045 [Nonomuraea basaltis]